MNRSRRDEEPLTTVPPCAREVFRARHVRRSGVVRLAGEPAALFAHFSPEGERRWAPDWDPEYLHPEDPAPTPGLVFRTRAGGETTLWLLLRYDTAAHEAEYVRVVPGSRMGTVRVACRAAGAGRTDVHVTYELTGLSEAGNEVLAAFTESAFAAMMCAWQEAISGPGASGRAGPGGPRGVPEAQPAPREVPR